MSQILVDIESLLLDGTGIDPAKGRRLASLTQTALERLLRDRGVSTALAARGAWAARTRSVEIIPPRSGDESRWAEDVAQALLRSVYGGL